MKPGTVAIVGVGLIGGSIGLALKQRRLARCVVGIGWRRESLLRARHIGAVDQTTQQLERGVAEADLVVFCTPVTLIVDQVRFVAGQAPAAAILTDCGSTKARIVQQLDATLPASRRFVGGHPLAGSEKRGVEHARPDLFEGRVCVVTRTNRTDSAALEQVRGFWEQLGARVVTLAPEVHDQIVGHTSHLPHLAAAALSLVLPERYHAFTAGGFRDTTRIAASDPELWTGIFLENADRLLEALAAYERHIGEFRTALERRDAVHLKSLWERSKRNREQIGRLEPEGGSSLSSKRKARAAAGRRS
jgi:prephenate dehydrogenase